MAECEDTEVTDLEETFTKAASHLQSLAARLDSGQLLGFYALYKQATEGSCESPRPNWYQTQAKHKWEAWKSLGDMSREIAMGSYIRAVGKLDPTWEQDARAESQAWVAVSRLPNTDAELRDIDKTILDWVKDGDVGMVQEALSRDPACVSRSDQDGMLPIHWAADRGHVPTLKCLVERGADVDAQDGGGQTPLHFAASCGHIEAVRYLLSVGATFIADNEGLTPRHIADDEVAAVL
ncbi:acyl-CoA-binding domain-containing protein 6 [Cephus cinctus]|uniref:Acyl-CoA-binding domain-containing protein 6 n=1 Tax=Cephus cinctus TaxID=211228 RepID=A0AAJ7BM15_CEPCN|nr:acyl-CoA-binding domain-containing protein 6 [Cephus cinctus]